MESRDHFANSGRKKLPTLEFGGDCREPASKAPVSPASKDLVKPD
jgi:hypothetical protein